MIVEGHAEVNQAQNSGATPRYTAAGQGHGAAERLLMAEGNAEANKAQNSGAAPLYMAAQNDHEAEAAE